MAEEDAPSGGNSLMDTFKSKFLGMPVGLWMILGVAIGGYLWYRHKQTSASTAAAAAATNSNLGSAGALADTFATSGQMPYSGGDVFLNAVGTGNMGNPPTTAPQTQTFNATPNETVLDLLSKVRKSINPNFSWADFWQLNPGIAKSLSFKNGVYKFSRYTTVVVSKPGVTDLIPKTPATPIKLTGGNPPVSNSG